MKPTVMQRLVVVALTLMLVMALCVDARTAQLLEEPQQQKYIFPIMLFGPNNQKRDLRHMLGLAKILDTGLVLTGIFKHYLDDQAERNARQRMGRQHNQSSTGESSAPKLPPCFNESYAGFMPFEEVIDREPIDAYVPTATVKELKAKGWDGKLDALMYSHDPGRMSYQNYLDRTCQATGVVLPDTAPRLPVMGGPLHCNMTRVEELKQRIQPYRYIALVIVLLGDSERHDLRREPAAAPEDRCRKIVYEADRLVRPAPWIRTLAQRYIEQRLGVGKNLAVHIRPYPDQCLQGWYSEKYNATHFDFRSNCKRELKDLHLRLGPCVGWAFNQSGAHNIFILSHPAIRGTVDGLLLKAGVSGAKYLEAPHVSRLAECEDHSATFLLMVEEAIAAVSESFLGTSWSSITHSIVYERFALGHNSNEFFEHNRCQ